MSCFRGPRNSLLGVMVLFLMPHSSNKDSGEKAAQIADRYGMAFVIIHVDCKREVALERISKRTPDEYESNAITEAAYYNNLRSFEPIDLASVKKKFPLLDIRYMQVETSESDPGKWLLVEDYGNKGKDKRTQ